MATGHILDGFTIDEFPVFSAVGHIHPAVDNRLLRLRHFGRRNIHGTARMQLAVYIHLNVCSSAAIHSGRVRREQLRSITGIVAGGLVACGQFHRHTGAFKGGLRQHGPVNSILTVQTRQYRHADGVFTLLIIQGDRRQHRQILRKSCSRIRKL